MGVDKPFNCDVSGCGMSFTNEDHLTVHRKKHEMCLSLNSENSAKSNNLALFVDQTPTPTRFIRNCEEVGLFQDLQSVNPFEEHFRKAAESVKMGNPPITGSLHVPNDNDILNTPSVLVSDDLEDDASLAVPLNVLNTSGGSAQLILEDGKDVGIMKGASAKDEDSKIEMISDDPVSDAYSLSPKQHDTVQTDVFTNESEILPFLPTAQVPQVNLAVVNNTSLTATEISLPSLNDALNGVPETQSSTSTITASTPMVHLILKLPDGSSIPVQVPALPAVLENSSTSNEANPQKKIVVNSSKPSSTSSKHISNIAKLKLRESLTQGLTAGENRALRIMNEQISSSLAELQNSNSTAVNYNIQGSNLQNKRRFGNEDNDIKRQKFLERNRAAATRCRQKRKQWVQSLESKADELAVLNQHLQNEVSLLRTEVTQLKSMLLAHKDCPVTQQQQKNLANLNGSTTTVIVSGGSRLTTVAAADVHSASTTSAAVALVNDTADRQTSPVIYRTIMSREQAIALLTGNHGISANRKVVVRAAPSTSADGST